MLFGQCQMVSHFGDEWRLLFTGFKFSAVAGLCEDLETTVFSVV